MIRSYLLISYLIPIKPVIIPEPFTSQHSRNKHGFIPNSDTKSLFRPVPDYSFSMYLLMAGMAENTKVSGS